MSDITAALAISQLKKIDRLIAWRIKIASEWNEIIKTDSFLKEYIVVKPEITYDGTHIYQSYVAGCRAGTRQEVMDYFKKKGFATGIGTHACHKYPDIYGWGKGLTVSDYLYDNAISLPRYYGLEVKEEWEKL
jgi:dTDP-4-amino-4,6-dideoxygalactose transaminase